MTNATRWKDNREEGNRASLFACAAALAVVGLVGVAWGAPERTAPKKDVEVVAVYYPHWHNYPKGIEWFGEKWKTGEWDFVKTARRLFPGHKQPLAPTPGYLDGANPKDVETEIALAANAGIDVFLWDYYWYGGKVTQEESIEQGFLKAKNRDRMKFALMWCYHERNDQFRPGLGPERRRLMSLDHTPEEFLGLIDHAIARYFNRPEYWRKDGKLFFSVYNAAYLLKTWGGDTAKVRAATDEARRRVREAGLGELHLNAQNLRPNQAALAVEMGFDSLTDYNLTASYAPNYWKRYTAGERLFGYDEIGAGIEAHWKSMQATALPYFPNVSTGWDSTPRCRLDAPFPWPKTAQYPYCATLTNNTPDRFEAYLRAAKAHVLADPKKPGVVYLNGWNEYTEGTYLLPNNFDSDGFLRAIAAVFGRQPANEYTYVNPSTKQLFTIPAATHENVAYGPHPKQKLDVFLPKAAKGPFPVVVYIHGGGWTAGAMEDHILGSSIRMLLDRGVAVVGTGYRYLSECQRDGVKPPVLGCLEDCERAVKFVRSKAREWNLDLARIALAGGSAGACTALHLALKDGNALGIAAVAPIIPQTSMDPAEMREWIPDAKYGAHAFGYRSFDDWLAHRADCLDIVERVSPAALLRKIDAPRAPRIVMQGLPMPATGERVKDATHSPVFMVKFKEIADAKGVPCEIVTGSEPCFGAAFVRLAEILKAYVPEPRPMKSAVEITALYYPGTEQMAEWDQVAQTLPGIKPLLGWYDESNPEVIDWQIKWAVEHGISSFCVDWYWNQGVQRLDHWVKSYYNARWRNYLKWYMMYANHNEPGAHSTEDQTRVTQFWIDTYFKTPEYYTIGGKPVVVYWDYNALDRDFIDEAAKKGETLKPGEGVKRALAITEKLVKAAGLPGVYFIDMYHGWKYEQAKVDRAKAAGYEAQMIYNFDTIAWFTAPEARKPGDQPNHFSYDTVMAAVPKWWEMTSRDPSFPLWPIVPTGWNDIPRSFQDARVIYGRTPEKFKKVCEECRRFCEKKGFNRVVIAPINEWQEGSYIEPNEEFGFGMYDALRDAFCEKPAEGWPKNLVPADVGLGPYDYPPMRHLALTSWDFSKGMQGWYRNPYGTAYMRTVDGAMRFFRSGGGTKPAIRTRVQPFEASKFKTFTVRMRVTPSARVPAKGTERMKLLWGTETTPVFSKDFVLTDANTAALPVQTDGDWHTVSVPLTANPNWTGRVNEIWFDPVNLHAAYVDIQWMRFEAD